MLSFDHEILVELFRGNSELAVARLRSCAGIAVDHARLELGSIDLSQVAPTEYRADAVVILRDLADRPVTGVIVEVQRQIKRDKLLTGPPTWPTCGPSCSSITSSCSEARPPPALSSVPARVSAVSHRQTGACAARARRS